jgi:integrating conjugative element protein (TIGR03756 family)
LLALLLAIGWIQPVPAASINTASIVAQTSTAALACMRWMPVGMCLWLRCSWSGCSVRSSIKVGHYNPDLVVSVYNELGANPWLEIRASLGLAQQMAARGLLGALLPIPVDSAGNRTEGTADNRDHRNLVFRETDAIGHPLNTLAGRAPGTGLLCQSQTRPFRPYLQSALNALAWRQEVPEIFYAASWIPGMREVGTWPLQTWGNVHPRTGWSNQVEEPKAAALNAQRAGDIVTRPRQPHVYLPLSSRVYAHNDAIRIIDNWVEDEFGELENRWVPSFRGQRVWPAGALFEKNARTGTWQMLAPRRESNCGVFGTNDLASAAGWGGGRVDPQGDYVWNLWRPYQCCERRGQTFLYDVNWISYPP